MNKAKVIKETIPVMVRETQDHPESLKALLLGDEYPIKMDLTSMKFEDAVETALKEGWQYFVYGGKKVPVTNTDYGPIVELSQFSDEEINKLNPEISYFYKGRLITKKGVQ